METLGFLLIDGFALMSYASVDDPVPRAVVARAVGVSERQLERLFVRLVGKTMNIAFCRSDLDRQRSCCAQPG